MIQLKTTSWSRAATLLIAIAALLAVQSFANRPDAQGPSKPAIIATFDLERTINSLEEKKAADAALVKVAEDLSSKSDEKAKAIKQMESELDDHLKGSEKYRQLLEKLSQDTQEYRAYIEWCTRKIDIDRGRDIKRIYKKIKDTAKQMAEENHYSVVFVDDSIAEIRPGNQDETARQIAGRRIVFASGEVDITEQMIQRMNSDYKASGGVIAPPTPAKTAAADAPGKKP